MEREQKYLENRMGLMVIKHAKAFFLMKQAGLKSNMQS